METFVWRVGKQWQQAPGGKACAPGRPSPAMIKAILIFKNHGKLWLSKFYQAYSEETQQQIIWEIFHLVS
ncbi:AP-3 complex subunit sigma-1 isoform X2, partial [Sigmodon hispidus]